LEEHLYELIVSPKSWLSNTLNKIQIKNIWVIFNKIKH
jgi:hypothetical protein